MHRCCAVDAGTQTRGVADRDVLRERDLVRASAPARTVDNILALVANHEFPLSSVQRDGTFTSPMNDLLPATPEKTAARNGHRKCSNAAGRGLFGVDETDPRHREHDVVARETADVEGAVVDVDDVGGIDRRRLGAMGRAPTASRQARERGDHREEWSPATSRHRPPPPSHQTDSRSRRRPRAHDGFDSMTAASFLGLAATACDLSSARDRADPYAQSGGRAAVDVAPALPRHCRIRYQCVPVWCAGIDVKFGRALPPASSALRNRRPRRESRLHRRPTRTRAEDPTGRLCGRAPRSTARRLARRARRGSCATPTRSPTCSRPQAVEPARPRVLPVVEHRAVEELEPHRHLAAVTGEQRQRGREPTARARAADADADASTPSSAALSYTHLSPR